MSNDKEAESSKVKVDELEEEQRLIALAKKSKPLEYGSKDDFQLAQALNHLKGLPVKVTKPDAVREESKDANKDAPPAPDSKPDGKKK